MTCNVLAIPTVNYLLFVCEKFPLALLESCSKPVFIVCVMYVFYFPDNLDCKFLYLCLNLNRSKNFLQFKMLIKTFPKAL